MKRLKCSITVEASLVMITVLVTIGMLITVSMSLYDKSLTRCVLLESMELYSHKYEDGDYILNENRLKNCMLSDNGSIMIEGDGITGHMTGKVSSGSIHFEVSKIVARPEKMMRAVTLTKLIEVKK